jgi:tRNA G10  N-methylase Trm11
MTYFILGSHPTLSKAELSAVLGHFEIIAESKTVLITSIEEKNLGRLQSRLAGIVKIGHIIGELSEWDQNGAAELIAAYASGAMGKNKICFGISVYDLGDEKMARELEGEIDTLGGTIKRFLKESGRPVRYVTSKQPRLSSVVVETNSLLSSGGEFVLLVKKDKILLGQTAVIQDFKAWSDRDYGRPKRDKRSGMLPPKLARIMINLSGKDPESSSLMDPFCGSGTVLMEASLMGWSRLVGSDISEKAVADTKKNLGWLYRNFDVREPEISILLSSAADLPSIEDAPAPVDAIVTEVFLGRPLQSTIDGHELKKTEKELMPIFEQSFESLKQLLKPAATLVVAFPAYKKRDGSWHHLPIAAMLEGLGYTVEDEHLYYRDKQLVARNIFVFSYSP